MHTEKHMWHSNTSTSTSLDMKPLITIATVTYNAESTLERTLRSVASQDYARIEHLIIDGCSKDHTLSLVQRYVEENQARHNIRLICEPDNGLYDAMNKALLNATGDYIVFLNAGDCLHSSDTISSISNLAQWRKGSHSHPAILYGDTHLVDGEGNFLRRRRLTPQKRSHLTVSAMVCSFVTSLSMLGQTLQNRNSTTSSIDILPTSIGVFVSYNVQSVVASGLSTHSLCLQII